MGSLQHQVAILCIYLSCVDNAEGVIHLTGYEKRAVNIPCRYREGYESYEKYFCKNNCYDNKDVLIRTSETMIKYSIHDDKKSKIFTVTINNLLPMDAGKYWCGVTKYGFDDFTEVQLKVVEDFSWQTTPVTVTTTVTTIGEYSAHALNTRIKDSLWQTTPATFTSTVNTVGKTQVLSKDAALYVVYTVPIVLLLVLALVITYSCKCCQVKATGVDRIEPKTKDPEDIRGPEDIYENHEEVKYWTSRQISSFHCDEADQLYYENVKTQQAVYCNDSFIKRPKNMKNV
ncbi:uncharacterized protein KZ484_024106 isoform 1-T1 [Pholidichthys leucotaenia]